MQESKLILALKGLVVGATMLVPGVSGGTMAMLLGVYDRLVSSVSSFMSAKRASFIFLALFALGGGAGMLLFAKPILGVIEAWPRPAGWFFLGAVAGGVPLMLRKSRVRQFNWRVPVYIALGAALVCGIGALPEGLFTTEAEGFSGALLLGAAGLLAAVSLVLPGISVSYFLLVLGLYDETMRAVSTLYLPFLLPLGIGLLLGVVLTARLLERAMQKYPRATYLIILGFVLGSMAEVFPGLPRGAEIVPCVLALCVGFGCIYALTAWESRRGGG